jgi:Flp pilus assembly protein TadB
MIRLLFSLEKPIPHEWVLDQDTNLIFFWGSLGRLGKGGWDGDGLGGYGICFLTVVVFLVLLGLWILGSTLRMAFFCGLLFVFSLARLFWGRRGWGI